MAIKVSLVEENSELREKLAASLNSSANVRCHACYGNSEEALSQIPLAPPDVVLIDINLPQRSGIECVSKLKAQLPRLQILMLTRFEQTELVFQSICAGASGFLLKNTPSPDLINAIESIHAGRSVMTMQLARRALDYMRRTDAPIAASEALSLLENDLLVRLSGGDSYEEISAALTITLTQSGCISTRYIRKSTATRSIRIQPL
jgi:DNA-binding NarL/FixJ family response regulator